MQVNPDLDENSVSSVVQIQMQVNPGLDENSVSSIYKFRCKSTLVWMKIQ